MTEHQPIKSEESIYQKIFGSDKTSLAGPLFFLLIGSICTIICLLLILFGISFNPGLLNPGSNEIGRPSLSFPIFNIIVLFSIAGAFVGIIMGLFGVFWFLITKYFLPKITKN